MSLLSLLSLLLFLTPLAPAQPSISLEFMDGRLTSPTAVTINRGQILVTESSGKITTGSVLQILRLSIDLRTVTTSSSSTPSTQSIMSMKSMKSIQTPSQTASPSPIPTVIPQFFDYAMTVEMFCQLYDENEIAADRRLKGFTVLMKGRVISVETFLGSPTVKLHGKGFFNDVTCFFRETELSALAELKKGSQVSVIGKVHGKGILEDCILRP